MLVVQGHRLHQRADLTLVGLGARQKYSHMLSELATR